MLKHSGEYYPILGDDIPIDYTKSPENVDDTTEEP